MSKNSLLDVKKFAKDKPADFAQFVKHLRIANASVLKMLPEDGLHILVSERINGKHNGELQKALKAFAEAKKAEAPPALIAALDEAKVMDLLGRVGTNVDLDPLDLEEKQGLLAKRIKQSVARGKKGWEKLPKDTDFEKESAWREALKIVSEFKVRSTGVRGPREKITAEDARKLLVETTYFKDKEDARAASLAGFDAYVKSGATFSVNRKKDGTPVNIGVFHPNAIARIWVNT